MGSDAPTGSKDKGNGGDPRNWGSSHLPDVELENDTQQALIDNAKDNEVPKKKGKKKRSKSKDKKRRRKSKKSKKSKKDSSTTDQQPSNEVTEAPTNIAPGVASHIRRIAEASKGKSTSRADISKKVDDNLRASQQVDPKSYLGRAFANIQAKSAQPTDIGDEGKRKKKDDKNKKKRSKKHHPKKRRQNHKRRRSSSSDSSDNDSSESSESEDSDPGSDPSSSSTGSESDDPNDYSSHSSSSDSSSSSESSRSSSKSHSDNKRPVPHKARKEVKFGKSLLKPIPPEKYDGSPHPQTFFRFTNQAMDYVNDGRVPLERQISIISHFLTGKAFEFYACEASLNPTRWDVNEFFEALFDYCFPPDFRSQQRRKLHRFHQGTLTVREYASQLNEFFSLLGQDEETNGVEMVSKCWYGLNQGIQQQL